jgi:hypothetical protein
MIGQARTTVIPDLRSFTFVYSNPREACTIDRDSLSDAVQNALSEALRKFGIPGADPGSIRSRVDAEVDATRQQCAANADKYASNDSLGNSTRDDTTAATAMAAPFVPSDEDLDPRQVSFGDRFGNRITPYPAFASRGTVQPDMPQQAAPLVGLVSGQPMSFYPARPPIFGLPKQAASGDEDWLLQLLAPRGRR